MEGNGVCTFVIADPQPLRSYGLRCLLDSQPRFQVVGEAASGTEALKLVRRCEPQCLMLAFEMPDMTGFQVLREVSSLSISAFMRRIMLCSAPDQSMVLGALYLGAVGIVSPSWSAELVLRTIAKIMLAGEYCVERQHVADLVHAMKRGYDGQMRYGLTPRELQIISCIVDGQANKGIAEALRVSEQTVKHHLSNIFDKVGVSSRLELAAFAAHHQLDMLAPEMAPHRRS
jgi:two-component system, NarL family, nitrate/nitrite response regulator NarL